MVRLFLGNRRQTGVLTENDGSLEGNVCDPDRACNYQVKLRTVDKTPVFFLTSVKPAWNAFCYAQKSGY